MVKKSRQSLLKAIHEALKREELIINLKDERKYTGAAVITPSKLHPVVTLEQNQSGRNVLFFDTENKRIFSHRQFVSAIRAGIYHGYSVKKIRGELTPVSRGDQDSTDNLG